MKLENIPNALSALRIVLAILLVLSFIFIPEKPYIAVLIFALGGITDVADGMLARRFGWITEAGKILDPLADKLMQLSALLCCAISGIIPPWLLAVCAAKELAMALGSLIFFKKFKTVGVSRNYGKAYSVLLYPVIGALIIFEPWFSANEKVKYALCIATALCGLAAVVLYYITYLKGELFKAQKG